MKKPKQHAPLECPLCGTLCKPVRETKDGGAAYRCRNESKHENFRELSFTINGDGELRY